jgi:molybdopterin/thiamine biosynthesis adenylyltransferase
MRNGYRRKMQIPFVHGAVEGFVGQVTTVFPEDKGLESIYGPRVFSELGGETEFGNPAMTPALIATWQVSEVVKILLERGNTLRNKVLVMDLKTQMVEIVDLI